MEFNLNKNNVIVVFGATASGKSNLALDIANRYNSVIINADSAQVYKDSPILSNIPTKEDFEKCEHYLFSFLNLNEDFSVGKWLKLVKVQIEEAISKNKTPIIVGGSGLYISSLLNGISEIPGSLEYKKFAQSKYEELGIDAFHKLVESIDFEYAKKVRDKQRLIRAYEVYLTSGKGMTYWHNQPKKQDMKYEFINLYVKKTHEDLLKSIRIRSELMLKKGAIQEVNFIMEKYKDINLLKKILGATEVYSYINNKINLEQLLDLLILKTKQYAKRQTTWFNNQIKDRIEIIN
jgi:tRNA dimethylallyltransferase